MRSDASARASGLMADQVWDLARAGTGKECPHTGSSTFNSKRNSSNTRSTHSNINSSSDDSSSNKGMPSGRTLPVSHQGPPQVIRFVKALHRLRELLLGAVNRPEVGACLRLGGGREDNGDQEPQMSNQTKSSGAVKESVARA